MYLHLVISILYISAPYHKCQNATKAKHTVQIGGSLPDASNNTLTTNNQANSGSVTIPGLVSIASLKTIIAGIMTETRRPVVVNNIKDYVTVDNSDRLCAFEKHNFRSEFGLGRKLKNEIVGALNKFRKEAKGGNMNCLLWSEKLASKASIKAKTCTYDHKNKASVMAMVFEKELGDSLAELAVRRWREEKTIFSYGIECRDIGGCQFQQIVWANSKEVGCAAERCADMTYLVCFFDPPGNVRDELPYLTGEPCTKCSAPQGSTPRCNKDKLCEW
ncbi:hypothetical protein LOTGIDRAFT_162767 [Lottia gigantea]|uniref:SCP domain-containing protein n=1 Tax=Lottia gigantea TaxID=225164 RepID=V4BU06_LOTGI|nr:hypothetical protein LOTGIDRAFT_162767 [Lottia gigantea]ESO92459.1 hypothetical protein LOTGIDRAFT_162767 [Lottia gigantea]